MKADSKTRRAFTLSEMVIVVVILGVLASFALPNYFRGLEKQRERGAVQNMQNIVMAVESWQAATSAGTFNSTNINTINNTLRTDVILEPGQSINLDITQTGITELTISWDNKTLEWDGRTACCSAAACISGLLSC